MRIARCLAFVLSLGMASIAHADAFDMRDVSNAVHALDEFHASVEDGRVLLRKVSFTPRLASGRCYASCVGQANGHPICSGPRGSYSFTFDIAALRPRLDDSLARQGAAADEFRGTFRHALRQWSDSVAKASRDLDQVAQFVSRPDMPGSRRDVLMPKLQQAETDLDATAKDVGVLRQEMARYLVRQDQAKQGFDSASAEMDANLSALKQQMDGDLRQKGCSDVMAVGPYQAFRQTVTAQASQIAAVGNTIGRRARAAEEAGARLLAATNRMTARVARVRQRLVQAQNLEETNAALADFQAKIAANEWRDFSMQVTAVAE
jgi:hypothetical protein